MMPTKQQIVDYWSPRILEAGMGADWADACERCWRCGYRRALERCHIIPRQEPFNGGDEPSNLVLLCRTCHMEAPTNRGMLGMFQWIRDTCVPAYDTFWVLRAFDSAERATGIRCADLTDEQRKQFSAELYRCALHGSHPTVADIINCLRCVA